MLFVRSASPAALAVRGVLAIIFGIAAIAWPGLTLAVLIALFGAYALIDGIFAFIAAFGAARHHLQTLPLVLEGITGVIIGILAFAWPGLTAVALVYLIAAWAIITGVLEIGAAIRFRDVMRGEWLLGLAGALSVLFGVFLALAPISGALAIVWLIGVYAILFGITLLGLAWRLHNSRDTGAMGVSGPASSTA